MSNEEFFVSYILVEKIGKYYRIFSMEIFGIEYYFVGSIKDGGFQWVYTNRENADDMFRCAEKDAEDAERGQKDDKEEID